LEVRDYCENVTIELDEWRTRVDGVMRTLDHVSMGDKEHLVAEVNELNMIVDELGDRINGLRTACMTNWKPEKEDHEVTWPKQVRSSRGRHFATRFGRMRRTN
jgi:hypothetical protein